MSALVRCTSAAVFCFALVASGWEAAAREPWPSVRAGSDKHDSKVLAALDEPTTLEFIETPLRDAVEFIKDVHDVEVQIDQRQLEEVGIGTESPVTLNAKNISLYAALDLIGDRLGLAYVVRDGSLLVTTPEAAEDHPEVRLYNVRELAGEQLTPDAVAGAVRQALGFPAAKQAAGGTAEAQPGGGPGSLSAAAASFSDEPVEQIIVLRDVLIVRGSLAAQRDVADLLAALAESLAKDEKAPSDAPSAAPAGK